MPPGNTQQEDFELRSWLADIAADGALSQDEISNLQNILGKEKVTGRLRDQVLMRRDYSRKTQEVADQRRSLEADVQSVLTERQNLANWKADLDQKYNKLAGDLENSKITEGQYRARISTLARTYGADEASLLEGISTPVGDDKNPHVNVGNSNGGDPKYLTQEEFNQRARNYESTTPRLIAEFSDLAEEHQELFGKSLRTFEYTDQSGNVMHGRSALLAKALEVNAQAARQGRPTRDLRQIWEQTFEVPKKREEIRTAELTTKIRGELDGEYRQRATEAALNGGSLKGRPAHEHGPAFREMKTPAEKDATAAGNRDNSQQNGHGDNGKLPPPTDSAVGRETRWMKAAEGFSDRRARGIPMGQPDVAKTT